MAKVQVDIIFIRISNIVPPRYTISSTEVMALMISDVNGPKINPPMTMIMSFGSYFKNETDGIIGKLIIKLIIMAIAHSIPIVVIFFVFIIFPPP